MDLENIVVVIIVMPLLLSSLNAIFLSSLFKRMKANSENLHEFKKIKWKWVLFYFTDIPIFAGSFLISIFTMHDTLIAFYISFIITLIYIGSFVERKGRKYVPYKKEAAIEIIRSKNHIRHRIDGEKNLNAISSTNTNETRTLTVNRIKAFAACLAKISVFAETEDVPGIGVIINQKCFSQLGTVSYGKTLSTRISCKSVELIFAIPLFNNLQNYMRYTILPGNKDVFVNVEPLIPSPMENQFKIEQLEQ